MKAYIKDGGPAFPGGFNNSARNAAAPDGQIIPPMVGMTLRDWFAGRALEVLLSQEGVPLDPVRIAKDAYEYADAMLTVRDLGDIPY